MVQATHQSAIHQVPNQTPQKPTLPPQHPLIGQLAKTIKHTWQEHLTLLPYPMPTDLGYVEGSLEGERLVVENFCYQTTHFRKLHIELAKVGNNLDILHCVMFPHPSFDLPIFGVDIVAGPMAVSAAIVDLSPVRSDRTLPPVYTQALTSLPAAEFAHPRDLPDWGDIFSDFCLFIRPTTAQEEQAFLSRVTRYLTLHCQIASQTAALDSAEARQLVLAGQRHYCSQQQKNDKTRRILERAFGADWAQRYLQTMLFDAP